MVAIKETLRTMTFDEWCDEFKPIHNPFSPDPDGTRFETYGREYEFVRNQEYERIWTEVDAEGEYTIILNGFHVVNRLAYYVTEVLHDSNTTYEVRDPELEKLH